MTSSTTEKTDRPARGHRLPRVLLLAAVTLLAGAGTLRAAADWEWTRDQGWTEGAGPSRATAEEQLEYAYSLEQKGEFYDAARQYFQLVRVFPETPAAGVGLGRLGLCLFKMENYYQSFKAIEQVLESYPDSGVPPADLLEIQYRIGQRLLAGAEVSLLDQADGTDARKASLRAAIEVFESILRYDPYGPLAAETLLALGDAHVNLQEPDRARQYYNRVMEEHRSRTEILKKANIGLVRCDVLEGKAGSREVETMIQRLRADAAREGTSEEFDENLRQLEEAEARKMWDNAQVWANMGTHRHVKSYKWQLSEIIRRYPHTSYARKAREELNLVEVPPEENTLFDRFSIVPKFWREEEKPAFVTPQADQIMVDTHELPSEIPGIPGDSPVQGESTAEAEPKAPQRDERYTMAPPAEGRHPPAGGIGTEPTPPVSGTRQRRENGSSAPTAPFSTGSAAGLTPGRPGDDTIPPGGWQLDLPDAATEEAQGEGTVFQPRAGTVSRTSEPAAGAGVPERGLAPATANQPPPAPRSSAREEMSVPGATPVPSAARGDGAVPGMVSLPGSQPGNVNVPPPSVDPELSGPDGAEATFAAPVQPPRREPSPGGGGWEFSEELR